MMGPYLGRVFGYFVLEFYPRRIANVYKDDSATECD